ncbi:MAG TPA: YncE family protein, partial [Gemmata sp.]|nr:YncE family protein [Gemmata sp.]
MHTHLAFGLVLFTTASAVPDEPKTLRLEHTVPLQGATGRYDHMALDAKGEQLFVANLSNDSLDVIDLKAGKLMKQIRGQKKIQGIAYVPELDRIFVGNGGDGECRCFDGKTYKLLGSVKLPDADNVRYDPIAKHVWVAHAEKMLTSLDPKTLEVKATVKLPGSPEAFQIDPERKRLYVNCLKPAMVAVVDTEKAQVMSQYRLTHGDQNYPMALDRDGGRVFVGCRAKPMVVALDASSGKELFTVDIPADIDDLFFDAKRKRLYASCGEGVLAVLEEHKVNFKLVEKIPTRKLARTCLFDANSGRLFVVLPRTD